jgi:predicted amidohydrolase YtcJ
MKTAFFGLLFSAGSWAAKPDSPPDLILAHGIVLTVDAKDTVAQALAIRGGRIVSVGTDAEVLALASKGTRIIDLKGRTATPGLIDTHAHLAEGGLGEVTSVQLSDAGSVAEILNRIRVRVAQVKPGEWVQGAGWDEAKLAEKRYIFASDLDQVAPNNPVWLEHTTGHYGAANSAALRIGQVTASSSSPPAGTIDRDAAGKPTGVLKEGATSLVTSHIPAPTPEQRRAGILRLLDTLHREGMTAIKDPKDSQPEWDAYHQLLVQGKLTAHVCLLWDAGASVESAQAAVKTILALPHPPQSLGDERLISCGAKIFMDGSGGGRTAWMYQPWNKGFSQVDGDNRGYPAEDPQVYREMVRALHRAGIHVSTHAIGDRAIDWVVDTYAEVLKETPTSHLRHGIIHANLPTDHAIETMARLQKQYDAGYPEMQPPFMWWLGDNYAGNLGPDRVKRLEPFKTLLARGVQWTGGSDYPVTPIAARYGLWSAVDRQTLKGTHGERPFGLDESVDIHAALRAYTSAAARQLFREERIGSLVAGKDADIAVWDKNPYAIPAAQLKDLACQMTLFHGEVVFDAQAPRAVARLN